MGRGGMLPSWLSWAPRTMPKEGVILMGKHNLMIGKKSREMRNAGISQKEINAWVAEMRQKPDSIETETIPVADPEAYERGSNGAEEYYWNREINKRQAKINELQAKIKRLNRVNNKQKIDDMQTDIDEMQMQMKIMKTNRGKNVSNMSGGTKRRKRKGKKKTCEKVYTTRKKRSWE